MAVKVSKLGLDRGYFFYGLEEGLGWACWEEVAGYKAVSRGSSIRWLTSLRTWRSH